MPKTKPSSHAVSAAQRRALLVMLMFVAIVSAKFAVLHVVVVGGATATGLVLDALFVFTVFAAVDLLFPDMRFRAMLITDVVLSLLALGVATFHSYYGLLPTLESLRAAGQATTVGTGIAELLDWRLIVFFADIPVLLAWVVRARRRGIDACTGAPASVPVCPEHRTPYIYQRRAIYAVAVVLGVILGITVSGIRELGGAVDNAAVASHSGMLPYVAAAVMGEGPDDAQALVPAGDDIQSTIDAARGGAATGVIEGFEPGVARGSHVIVIQVEALQAAVIGAKVGGEEVTPNLNRLVKRSWYYPNALAQIGLGTTSDAEYLANTSLYTPANGAASMLYADKELSSLPRLLGREGYDTMTFHTNTVEYWNRSQLYPALGFDRYYDDDYFGQEDKVAFGASDEVLYRKTLDELARRDAAGTPFYAQVVSMSSHYPFIALPQSKRHLKITDTYRGTKVGDYLIHAHYADEALGGFIDELERTGMLDRSTIVIYGDHFGLQEPDNERELAATQELLGHPYTPVDKMNVPLIVRVPGQTEGHEVVTPAGQVDIMPSLAHAMGLDLSGFPQMGRSVFSDAPVLMSAGGLLPVGSYVDGDVLYVSGASFETGQVWDIARRVPAGLAEASSEKRSAVLRLLEISRGYVKGLPVRADYDPDAKTVLPD